MSRIRLYYPHELQLASPVRLTGDAAHYLARVMRVRVKQSIHLFNGCGGQFLSEVIQVTSRYVDLCLLEYDCGIKTEAPAVHLYQCVSKPSRMDWAIQKATECGVAHITPVLSARSAVNHASVQSEKKLQHWQAIAISAAEQSGRCDVPMIHPVVSFAQLARCCDAPWYIASIAASALPVWQLDTIAAQLQLLVGPEGGLSDDELAVIHQWDAQLISLGGLVLRTETAPVVAITALAQRYAALCAS